MNPLNKGHRIFFFLFAAAGLMLSALSGTDLCSFGGCAEAHRYLLFGLPLPGVGIAFFTLAGLFAAIGSRFSPALFLFNLMLAGAVGSEVELILLQKYIIKAWCPLCLGIAATVFLMAGVQLARYITSFKEGSHMKLKLVVKPLLIGIALLAGFSLTLAGLDKPAAAEGKLNLHLGKQESTLEVYFFSDWLCPFCANVESVMESVYPDLSHKAKILFVDKIVHPDAMNFVPYDISFEAHEKGKYLQLRKALFTLAKSTRNPTYEDVKAAVAPLKVTYRQLSFLEVTQQMAVFQKLAERFKVTSTPTMVIHSARTNRTVTMIGNGQITKDNIMKAVKELE
jgi:Vitamin K epoxide reductase family/Thioredoxin